MALKGRVALVTGAGSERGLGNAIARALAKAGATVVLSDIDVDGARRNAAAIGTSARALAVDVTSEESVAEAVREVGRVDVLVNNAGITQRRAIWDLSIDDFDRILAVNLRGGFLCLSAVVKGMMERRWGRVIWISSVAGKQGGGIIGTAHYESAKSWGVSGRVGRWPPARPATSQPIRAMVSIAEASALRLPSLSSGLHPRLKRRLLGLESAKLCGAASD